MKKKLPQKSIKNFQESLQKETGFKATGSEAESWAQDIFELLQFLVICSLNSKDRDFD